MPAGPMQPSAKRRRDWPQSKQPDPNARALPNFRWRTGIETALLGDPVALLDRCRPVIDPR
jgi:hypothetical protein